MDDPDKFDEILDAHFAVASDDEVEDRLRSARPQSVDEALAPTDDAESQLVLQPTARRKLRLNAYLASALTGLNEKERQLVFELSDIVAESCAAHSIDLYEPRKQTDPIHHPSVSSPEVWEIDHERVLDSDLVVHLCHHPSTGAGEELAFAHSALVPILLISHEGATVSRMVAGIPAIKVHIEYSTPEQLGRELDERLAEMRPLLEQRKLAFADHDQNVVGEKVRLLRESQGMTRHNVADAAGMDSVELTRLEESTDRAANWTLTKLRAVATVLKTTVSDLVEPDLGEQIMAAVNDWVRGRESARFPKMSQRDQRRLVHALLSRVVEEIDPEKDDDGSRDLS